MLLRIAQQLDIPPQQLGISHELLQPVAPPATSALVGHVDSVEASQAAWRSTRRYIKRTRGALARTSAELYRADARLSGVPFIARREWVPRGPLRLDDITLEWVDDAAGTSITGNEPEASRMLPLRAPGQRFNRYTSAMRYLDPPTLFENDRAIASSTSTCPMRLVGCGSVSAPTSTSSTFRRLWCTSWPW